MSSRRMPSRTARDLMDKLSKAQQKVYYALAEQHGSKTKITSHVAKALVERDEAERDLEEYISRLEYQALS